MLFPEFFEHNGDKRNPAKSRKGYQQLARHNSGGVECKLANLSCVLRVGGLAVLKRGALRIDHAVEADTSEGKSEGAGDNAGKRAGDIGWQADAKQRRREI